jgi:hypothetical protein
MLAKKTFLISAFTDIEQYCQELNENLIISSKDSGKQTNYLLLFISYDQFLLERDMADQRSQQFQTILLAATIMSTALISVLIQGNLPEKENKLIIFIMYSICNSLSLVLLLMCTVLCVEITSRFFLI